MSASTERGLLHGRPPPNAALAHVPVLLPSWEPALARALWLLLRSPPRHASCFRRTLAHARFHGSALESLSRGAPLVDTQGFVEEYPLATALLALGGSPSPFARTLAWLALELHLRCDKPENVALISQWIRGISAPRGPHRLIETVADCDSLPSLARRIAHLGLITQTPNSMTGHQNFDIAWSNWLAATINDLLLPQLDPFDHEDDEPSGLPLEGPNFGPISLDQAQWPEDPEEEISATAPPVSLAVASRDATARRLALATAQHLYRRSSPDLLRAPDNILPAEIAAGLWSEARDQAAIALSRRDIGAAEEGLAHLLAIETGLSERETPLAAFGSSPMPDGPSIDLEVFALRRAELRPPRAFLAPKDQSDLWADTGGDILFPLSPALVDLAKELLALREANGARPPISLLFSIEAGGARLRRAIARIAPPGLARPSDYRRRLAAGLAETLGPDAAQVAFGDTFGDSSAPTYYAAFPSALIVTEIATRNAPITGVAEVSSQCLNAATHVLGSRARARHCPFAALWQSQSAPLAAARGRPRIDVQLSQWQRRRDCLALHLLLATGHRPSRSFGKIRLTDFLPEHGLVLLTDKQSDPARLTRLAATGWRFIGALEQFVRELRRIAHSFAVGPMAWLGKGARLILSGEAPVFSLPTSEGATTDFDVRRLIAEQPEPWRLRPNLHRHAVNHALIKAGVDPELRYFQMGWLHSEMHAVGDAAPMPPEMLGAELAGHIDTWLSDIGWEGGELPTKPAEILANTPLRNFHDDLADHQSEHNRRRRELLAALSERRRQALPEVLSGLAAGFKSHAPSLLLVPSTGRTRLGGLARQPNCHKRPHVDNATVEDLLACFDASHYQPIHAFLAPRVLSALLLRAVRAGVCTAALPAVRAQPFSDSNRPSPFVAHLGLAVAHAQALRRAIRCAAAAAGTLGPKESTEQLAVLFLWSLLANTPYRRLSEARAVAGAARQAEHSASVGWLFRLPSAEGHTVITGPSAVLLARLRSRDGWEDAIDSVCAGATRFLGRFVSENLADICPRGMTQEGALNCMLGALEAAAAVELNGAERLLLERKVRAATVPARRAASSDDAASLLDDSELVAEGQGDDPEDGDEPASATKIRTHRRISAAIRDLMRKFEPDYSGDIDGQPAKPAEHRIAQLLPHVDRCLTTLGSTPSPERTLVDYVRHLAKVGGPRSRGGMQVSSIYSIYHRIRPVVEALPPVDDVKNLGPEELTAGILLAMGRSSNKDKHDVLDDVRRFFRYILTEHGAAEPDWELVHLSAGVAIKGTDPAVISDDEARLAIHVLAMNIEAENLVGLDPIERRFRELHFVSAVLLEASGIRPRSLYGLTLADLHFLKAGAFVHLKRSGSYASIKTSTSAGFVTLKGHLWSTYARWVEEWVETLRNMHAAADLDRVPLFQRPNSPIGTRFPIKGITGRIGEVIRWATQQQRGRTYWLRKRRVLLRHRETRSATSPRARHVFQVLKESGHASITTPIASYLGDPLAYQHVAGQVARTVERSAASAYSGLNAGVIDQRWRRLGASPHDHKALTQEQRLCAVLHLANPTWPASSRGEAPPYRPLVRGVTWQAVERVIIELGREKDTYQVSRRTGVDQATINAIQKKCTELERRSGWSFGGTSRPLSLPRETATSLTLRSLLLGEDQHLVVVSREWVQCARIPGQTDGIVLIDDCAIAALRAVACSIGFTLLETQAGRDALTGGEFRLTRTSHASYGAVRVLRWVLGVVWVATAAGAGAGAGRDLALDS